MAYSQRKYRTATNAKTNAYPIRAARVETGGVALNTE
jgi:hypothetical protein